jgi:hypothetical protein
MRTRGLAGEYPAVRMQGHAAGFSQAVLALRRSMADFRAMPPGSGLQRSSNGHDPAAFDESVRGLAPALELAPLLEPSFAWSR